MAVIKIKSSALGGTPATNAAPSGIAIAELAYSYDNNVLIIGNGGTGNSTNKVIGGAVFFDPLTANYPSSAYGKTGTGSNVLATAPTLTKLNLSDASNQIVFNSAGTTGTLTWVPATTAKTITLPDLTGIVMLTNGGQAITSGSWTATVIGATYGGTGQITYTAGDLLYSNTANALAKLGVGAAGQVLRVATGLPAWGAIDLANSSAVTGILPLANGGTGVTLATTGPGFLRQASANATVTVSAIVAADLPGSFNGFATPATSIGLTATAGSATTAMRSDGAPALSVAIAPTWTAQHIFSNFAPQCSVAPTGDSNLANKLYVDTVAQGLHVHPPADVILLTTLAATVTGTSIGYSYDGTAGTITISGTSPALTVDSVVMANWTRIVIAGETSTTSSTTAGNKEWHGIYTKTTSTTASIVLTRAVDANYISDLNGGDFIFIQSGTIYADTGFVQTLSSVLGLVVFSSGSGFMPVFVQFSQAGVVSGGAGLTKTGTTLDVVGVANSITVNADSIEVAATYAGGSYIATVGTVTSGTIDGGTF